MFDYEWATVQHNVNCRLAAAVVVPDAIPPERLYRYGARGKVRGYPGLKEEYYLADFEPDPRVLADLGLGPRLRPAGHGRAHAARGVAVPPLRERPVRAGAASASPAPRPSFSPGRPSSARSYSSSGGFIVPERAIDAQSLIAYADVVVSAGGTMNREAVALGTPVYTVFEGRLGAVDERLIAEGRLRRLTSADELELGKRDPAARGEDRVRRDPGLLADLLLGA